MFPHVLAVLRVPVSSSCYRLPPVTFGSGVSVQMQQHSEEEGDDLWPYLLERKGIFPKGHLSVFPLGGHNPATHPTKYNEPVTMTTVDYGQSRSNLWALAPPTIELPETGVLRRSGAAGRMLSVTKPLAEDTDVLIQLSFSVRTLGKA